MWLITTTGFFSVVQKPGEEFLTVRARVAADLDSLRKDYMLQLSETICTPHADYKFRATISHVDFGAGLALLAQDIHYGNFKSEIMRLAGIARERIYARVWQVLMALEELKQ